jgi:hypothetical protein
MENRIVVYTALFGNYSGLIEQPTIKGVDFICYTDQDISSKSWQIKKVVPPVPGDNTRSNRYYKLLPHKHLDNYDISVYIDANYLIIKDFSTIVREKLKTNLMVCFDHNQTILDKRDCIYEEHNELVNIATNKNIYRDSLESMQRQIDFFKQENYPSHNGLIFAAVLIRKHKDKEIITLMELWWSFVKNRSRRDQLSFNYCVWKLKFNKFEYLDGDLRRGNPWFYWFEHHLNFEKEIKKLKRSLFLEKHFPIYVKVKHSTIYILVSYYVHIPYILFNFNKWCRRYSNSKLQQETKKELLKIIFKKRLNKKEIVILIEKSNT